MAFEMRRMHAAAVVAVLSLYLVSCTSTSREETVSTANAGADRSGVYPDITAPVSAAAPQMSNATAQEMEARLSALAGQRRSGAVSEAEYRRRLAELQALGQSHGKETLAAIEGEN